LRISRARTPTSGYVVTITSKDKLPIKHYLEGDVLIVDISKPAPPVTAAAPAPAQTAAAKPAPPPPASAPILLTPPKPVASNAPALAVAPVATSALGGPERVNGNVAEMDMIRRRRTASSM
jgi:hypothetical protein